MRHPNPRRAERRSVVSAKQKENDVVKISMTVHTSQDMVGNIVIEFVAVYRGGKYHFVPGTVKEHCPPVAEMAVV